MNGVDAKNRLSVPAPLRETIEARSQLKCVVLAPAEHAPCLIGYDVTHFERVQEGLSTQFVNDFGPGRSLKARSLFGMAEQLNYDHTGRIIMPPILREIGEIKSQALFLGAGDYFELWDPEVLVAEPEQDPRLIRMAKALMAQKGAA